VKAMRRLDGKRAFGTVMPPLQMPGCDRLVAFEQSGQYFDIHQRQVVPGQPLNPDDEAAHQVDDDRAHETGVEESSSDYTMPLSELIAQAPAMVFNRFKMLAREFLGDNIHRTRQQISTQLKELARSRRARLAAVGTPRRKRARVLHAGDRSDRADEAPAPRTAPAQPSAPDKGRNGTRVDLAPWARGEKEYPFGRVAEAIKEQYAMIVTGRREALVFLIDQEVIKADDARQDVGARVREREDEVTEAPA